MKLAFTALAALSALQTDAFAAWESTEIAPILDGHVDDVSFNAFVHTLSLGTGTGNHGSAIGILLFNASALVGANAQSKTMLHSWTPEPGYTYGLGNVEGTIGFSGWYLCTETPAAFAHYQHLEVDAPAVGVSKARKVLEDERFWVNGAVVQLPGGIAGSTVSSGIGGGRSYHPQHLLVRGTDTCLDWFEVTYSSNCAGSVWAGKQYLLSSPGDIQYDVTGQCLVLPVLQACPDA